MNFLRQRTGALPARGSAQPWSRPHARHLRGFGSRGLSLITVAAIVSLWIIATSEEVSPQQRLRSGIDLVELDVIVLDKDRRPVRGLTQQDFTVKESDDVRPILGFVAVDLAPTDSVEPTKSTVEVSTGVVTNAQQSGRGRLVIIVFDRSIPAGPPTTAAKAIARAAVEAMGPNDLAAVVRTSGFANDGKSQNLTRDRHLLLEATDSDFVGLVSPPTMASGGLQATPPDLYLTGDCLCGLCSLEAIERIANAIAPVRNRQKVILFLASNIVISDGGGPAPCLGRVNPARNATLQALDRANVTVHSIDPLGLETMTSGVGAVERRFEAVRRYTQARQLNLSVLPAYTGGRFVRNTNAPGEIVPEIFAETSSYYLIGFERGGSLSDASQRPVKVRVNRPGVTVVARKAFYSTAAAPNAAPTDPLDETITGVLPRSDVPMALSLATVFAASGEVRTNVLLGVDAAFLGSKAGAPSGTEAGANAVHERLHLRLGVFDERARTVLTRSNPLPVRAASCGAEWCETISQLELNPGRYEIRAGVLDRASTKQGSVYGYIEVPTLRGDTFLLSNLQIGLETSGDAMPSVRRTFRTDERLAIFTQVRRPLDSDAPVTLRVAITNGESTIVAQSSSILEVARFSASGVSDVKVDQSLSKLSAGTYMLTMEAVHLGRVTRRSVSFDVR